MPGKRRPKIIETACTEPELGALLHAYEIDLLSDADRDRFEIHLLSCEACFSAVAQFDKEAQLMREDPDVAKEILQATGENGLQTSDRGWSLKRLWPRGPLFLRPALLYILVLTLLYPAYLGLTGRREPHIRPLQTIVLIPVRSGSGANFSASAGRDGVISFVYRDAVPGQTYRVTITRGAGDIVMQNDNFAGFGNDETGYLLFPADRMKPGHYTLTISNGKDGLGKPDQVYTFSITD